MRLPRRIEPLHAAAPLLCAGALAAGAASADDQLRGQAHDGSVERLDRAVRIMAAVQLGRTLDDEAVGGIVSFLESLTGEVPSNYAPPGKRPEM